MQLRYGSLWFDIAGAGVSVTSRTEENAAGIPFEREVTGAVEGWWTGSTNELIVKSRIMEASLAIPYQDLVLLTDAGVVAFQLPNAGSISGVRVLDGPHYLDGRGSAEFATYRTFRFVATASYPLIAGPVVMDFREELGTSGGGPVYDFMQPVNDYDPVPVRVFARTPYRAFQRGYAVTRSLTPLAFPTPPPPLFPGALLMAPTFNQSSERAGGSRWHLRSEWAYEFGSNSPLLGVPNVWR